MRESAFEQGRGRGEVGERSGEEGRRGGKEREPSRSALRHLLKGTRRGKGGEHRPDLIKLGF